MNFAIKIYLFVKVKGDRLTDCTATNNVFELILDNCNGSEKSLIIIILIMTKQIQIRGYYFATITNSMYLILYLNKSLYNVFKH